MDTLVGATRWQVSSEDEEDYMAEDLFLVRDHLGSVVMTLKAQKTCTMRMEPPGPGEGDPECGAWAYVLNPIETFEYDPYGQPTAHVPASESTPQGPGYLALKTVGAFAISGEKSGYTLLDRNDISRPNGTPGHSWVRNGAVPAAQSHHGWNYLFTGRPWDADVRQYYIRHRWYDPLQGRWTAVDPISYRGGLNQYQYCGGNPMNWIDPRGLAWILIHTNYNFFPHTGFNIDFDDPKTPDRGFDYSAEMNNFGIPKKDPWQGIGLWDEAPIPNVPSPQMLAYGFWISDTSARLATNYIMDKYKGEYRFCDLNCNTVTKDFIVTALRIEAALIQYTNWNFVYIEKPEVRRLLEAANDLESTISQSLDDPNVSPGERAQEEGLRQAAEKDKATHVDLGYNIYKWIRRTGAGSPVSFYEPLP